ncbi:MAG: type II secretion system protein [Alphaproteobacteria bacterium]|nr:type II secretion system protein [Alphaproteobacteria bacterium]
MKRCLPPSLSKRGFTLTELCIVIGVIGLCMSAVWTVARNMQENAKQAAFAELLLNISRNIRGYASGLIAVPTTNTNTIMSTFMSKGVFPSYAVQQVGATWVIVSPFGRFTNPHLSSSNHKGLYACGWLVDGAGANTHCNFSGTVTTNVPLFAIEALMPRKYCIPAAMRNSLSASLPGLVAIYINGIKQTMPLNLNSAAAACNRNVNYVDWVFRPNS